MHIILSVLTAIAILIFWMGRAARGARDIADTAQEISNLPRKMRYRKQASKQGLDLVQGPVEAATVMMIAIARMDGTRRVSDAQEDAIIVQLVSEMQMSHEDAADLVLQMRGLTQYLIQADSVLFPMVELLKKSINSSEAKDLSNMLIEIANVEDVPNMDQTSLIRRFEERMGISHP